MLLWGYFFEVFITHFLCYCLSQLFSTVWLISVWAHYSQNWNNSLLLRWRNPRRSTTCLWSGRSNEAQLGKGVSHSSAEHCALPWYAFANWDKWVRRRIIIHICTKHDMTGSGSPLIVKLPLFCWEWPFSVTPWPHNTFHHVSVLQGKPASQDKKASAV